MRKFIAVLTLGAALWLGATQLAEGQTDGQAVVAPPPVKICNSKCHMKRDYGKLRRSTTRHPVTACIVDHESGGNLHADNPNSDAGGRYQIMPSTWAANLPSKRFIKIAQSVEHHFRRPGHDEGPQMSERLLQDKVASNIVKSSGYAPWTQYDGC